MNKIKKILIILCVIILILIILIYFLLNKQNQENNTIEEDNTNEFGEEIVLEKDDNGYDEVSDAGIFFSVINTIEKYEKLCKLNIENASAEVYTNNDEYLLNIKNEDQRNNAIYNLLDKQYIRNNGITTENMKKYLYNIDIDTILVPKRMKVKYGENINTYVYEAYLAKDKKIENKYFIIRINNSNQTFSLEFVNDNINDISKINANENESTIKNTGYNEYNIETITTDQVVKKYFDKYKDLILINPEIIYNEYLEDKYKQKRYGSLEEFNKYINNNINEIEKEQIIKYTVNTSSDNKTEYICVDQNENYYIFSENSAMQYTIKFDNYTLPTEKFTETYNKSTEEQKVQMNINKFIQMINRQDYKTSYNLIDSTFKNNYFETNREFEEFIKNRFFLYNKISFKNITKEGNSLFLCDIEISDLSNEEEQSRDLTIVMKLNNELNFVMSFIME